MSSKHTLPGNQETHVAILTVLVLGIVATIANLAYGKGASLAQSSTTTPPTVIRKIDRVPGYIAPGYMPPGYQVQTYNPPGYATPGYTATGAATCALTVNSYYCKDGWITCRLQPVAQVPKSVVLKGSGKALYWYGKDGKRYVFPNEQTYRTWFVFGDKCPVIRQASDDDLKRITLGGNVTYRPGQRMLKLASDSAIYAVSKGGVVRRFANETLIASIFGKNWRNLVDTIPDAFFVHYSLGAEIKKATDYVKARESNSATTIDQDKGL